MADVHGGRGAAGQVQPPLPPYPPPPGDPPPSKMPYVGEPIALGLGVDYPFPPHLEYAYPPPDGNILTNVVNALIAVPRFYTQVLHLMNKMNLPAPFRPALPTPPLPPARHPEPIPAPPPPPPHQGDLSSGESELESSDEDKEPEHVDQDSVKSQQKKENRRKRRKLEAVLGPAGDKDASHEAAGVKSMTLTTKEATTIKKKQPVLQIKITSRGVAGDPTHEKRKELVESPVDMPLEVRADEQPLSATRDELLAGRVHHTELLTQAAFKNYTPGNPTQVLYIKNLAKDVAIQDLYYVFGAFFHGAEEARSALTVKLMQEGRMRGQAFVTFPSTDLAADALNTTNGFSLKGKPMIVQFGRNPSAAKATAS